MKRHLFSGAVVAALTFLTACGGGEANPTPPGTEARSSKARITTAAPAGDVAAAVQGNTDFGLSLYRTLSGGSDDNLFISPHSISLALSLTYAGAAGDTATAFESTMHQSLPAASYHRAMNDLDRQLTSRGQGAKAADGKEFRLNLANQLFSDKTFVMKAPYLDTLAQEYGAGVRLLDFRGAPDPSRVAINDWVSAKTEDRIKELLKPGIITPDTRTVLVNAIYFNAAWKTPFEPGNTTSRPFHTLAGGDVDTQMMQGSLSGSAATVDGVEVASLPYDGQELSMLLLMPPSDFSGFEAQLTAEKVASYVGALQPGALNLTMPKFEHRTSAGLAKPLADMGLQVAFTDAADFSAMTDERVSITDVVHEAFVKLDEKGTEAAAATAVIVGETSVMPTHTVTFDRPFIYMVRDDATGAVVFLGRYVKP